MAYYQTSGPNRDPNFRSGPFGSGNAGSPQSSGYHIPVWMIVLGFIIAWPLGLALLIAHFCEGSASGVKFNQSAGAARPTTQGNTAAAAQPRPAPQPTRAAKKKKTANKDGVLPLVLTIIGAFTLLVGGVNLMDTLQYALPYGIDAGDISSLISAAGWSLSGLGMLFGAARLRLGNSIRKKICNIVGKADHMPIAEVAEALPADPKKAAKYLQQCIDRGSFGPEAYLDMRSDNLVVRGPAPAAERETPKAAPVSAAPLNTNKYDMILRRLHTVNEAIPGEQMTAKIDRLENVTAKIFKLVQENPDKLPQMRKFMDYYLPTSLKLLNNYAQLDAQGVEGENISESKRQIESTMDTLVNAFEKQLDKLFYMDSIDISADITTMQNMMAADGLTGNEFEAPAAPQPPKL